MALEWFLKLKEIDSLSKMKIAHLKTLNGENERITKLINRLNEAKVKRDDLKQSLIQQNDLMESIERNLQTASIQKQRLLDIGSDDSKVGTFTSEITKLEEYGLEILEKVEEIAEELKDNKTFIVGVERTIQEIEGEIKPEREKLEQEIKNIELRINLLREELPSDYKNILDKTTAKNLAQGPFTRIDQGSCYFCRYKISRIEESEIDMQKGLKTCPQCSRIFLPYGS